MIKMKNICFSHISHGCILALELTNTLTEGNEMKTNKILIAAATVAMMLSGIANAATFRAEADLVKALRTNKAVIGARAYAKAWAGGSATCSEIQVEELSNGTFKALLDCTQPDSGKGPVGDGASAQFEISGSVNEGVLFLDKIEFHYAG
jgi:hypothetical protein